ncbi:MAG: PASTA domain-containing protein [Elioraea sp.]|nr:PASTA domain-containing protein [Elioraea sp.]MDW8445106.1 PASTA domain-containing protein [Acetobacteraceae bacterium]
MPDEQRLAERLGEIEKRLTTLDERLAAVERAVGAREGAAGSEAEAILRKRVTALEAERRELMERIAALGADRLRARPEQVTDAFRRALEAMQTGLAPRPGDRAAYAVSALQVALKALVSLDRDGAIAFVLPSPEERFESGQLSEVTFTLRATAPPEPEPQLVAVPSLLGLPLAAADEALARVGLKVGRTDERESRYPVGTVIGQSPDPGVEVAPDRPVDLVVAAPVRSVVPKLVGLALDEAKARLDEAGLVLGRTAERLTREAAENTVLEQHPAAGTRVDPGSTVALVLAQAPPPTALVPALKGQPLAAAETALRASGLARGAVKEQPGPRPGIVLDQHPKAGTEVAPGTAVDLVVSSAPAVEVLIERAVRAAASTRAGISGKLLGERLRALGLRSYEDFVALANAPREELQRAIGAPTPRGLEDARAALRKALEGSEDGTLPPA